MALDLRDATIGITMQLAQRKICGQGDIYLFSKDSYARFRTFGSGVSCSGEVSIGNSPLTDIIARELAKPQTLGIATHSRSVFEWLLNQGMVIVLGNGVDDSLYGPKIGGINVTAVSVPANDPHVTGKLGYLAGSRNPVEDVAMMRDTELLWASSIPAYQVQKVPEALLATSFMQPNKPQFKLSMKGRMYELFV